MRWRSTRLVFAAGVALTLLFIIVHRFRVLTPLEAAIARTIQPLSAGIASGARLAQRLLARASGVQATLEENERLRREIDRLLIAQENQRLGASESVRVETALRVLGERRWQGTIARVIGRSPDPTFRLFLLNRGTNQGVQPGTAVIVGDGIFVGKILEADAHTAKLLLLTDPHSQAAGLVENDTQTEGLLTGEHGLSLRLDLLNKNDRVEIGQLVVSSGLEPGVPKGLVVGRITRVDRTPSELFQSATVEPADPLTRFDVVTILTAPHA